jgi:hypothetical protein
MYMNPGLLSLRDGLLSKKPPVLAKLIVDPPDSV